MFQIFVGFSINRNEHAKMEIPSTIKQEKDIALYSERWTRAALFQISCTFFFLNILLPIKSLNCEKSVGLQSG